MFNLLDIGERAGSGIPSICHTWEKESFRIPEYTELFNPDRTILKLPFNDDIWENDTDSVIDNVSDSVNVIDNVIGSVSDNVAYYVSDNRRKLRKEELIEILKKDGAITVSKLATELGVSERTILRDIESLKNENRISREGSDISGYWQVFK